MLRKQCPKCRVIWLPERTICLKCGSRLEQLIPAVIERTKQIAAALRRIVLVDEKAVV